jgi:hypothetical protein
MTGNAASPPMFGNPGTSFGWSISLPPSAGNGPWDSMRLRRVSDMGFEADPKNYHRVVDRENNYACEVFARDVPRDERWFHFYLKDFRITVRSRYFIDEKNFRETYQISRDMLRRLLVGLGDQEIKSSMEQIFHKIAEAIIALRRALFRLTRDTVDVRVIFI